MISRFLTFAFLFASLAVFAQAAPQDVDITSADGTKLKATYYPAAKPGPGVLLLHMCNSNRQAWEPVATQLSAAGIHALALDYRGYGESGGDRFQDDPQKQQQVQTEKWPGDIDAAFHYLSKQSGVDKNRIGAGGGSCGVNQAIQVARRHPEVKSLVLLAGGTGLEGLNYLYNSPWLPILASSASDDGFDRDPHAGMKWLLNLSGNPRNRYLAYDRGGHGTQMFKPNPDLPKQIVAWYVETLVKKPADSESSVARKKTPEAEFWAALNSPGGAEKAAQMFRDARMRDPKASPAPQQVVNQIAYDRMQSGNTKDAVTLAKLNVEAFPESANAYDSLGDAYLADGQNELALQSAQKAIEVLPNDQNANDDLKKLILQSAEDKIAKLKPSASK
jgi:dienelactone hydrolase